MKEIFPSALKIAKVVPVFKRKQDFYVITKDRSPLYPMLVMLNFEDLIQKVNETIYLSHFYISDYLTQIHKEALFIYHMQFFQKVLVSTMR